MLDLGIIGNCQYNALIDAHGDVKWLCFPRFDSSFVFGSLLDEELGGEFSVNALTMEDHRKLKGKPSYIENTNILKTTFKTPEGKFELIDFAPRFRNYERYYRPTMMIRILRPIQGSPVVKVKCSPRYDYGLNQPKAHVGSNHIEFLGVDAKVRLTTNISLSYVQEEKPFVLNETKYLVFTWGPALEAPLEDTCEVFLVKTREYWKRWIKHTQVPTRFQKEVIRSALVLKLHQFEDTGAIIASTTTSIPEAKNTSRNWDYRFCWLRDAAFALLSLQQLGQFEEMEGFENYLMNIAESSGRDLQPLYSISGDSVLEEKELLYLEGYESHKPVRVGNKAYEQVQYDIFGEMIMALSPLFLDHRFRSEEPKKEQFRLIGNLVHQIEKTLDAPDSGIWELRNTQQIHCFTVLMHWVGLKIAAKVAREYKDKRFSTKLETLIKDSEKIIEKNFWNPKIKAYTQSAKTEHLDASLLMMVNFGYLKKDNPKSHQHVNQIMKQLTAKNGLLFRYKHEDDFGKPDSAFTICSFWLVEALCRLDRKKEANQLFEKPH